MSIVELRIKRNRLKKQYIGLTGTGAFCLLLAILVLLGGVGPDSFTDYVKLYQTQQTIQATLTSRTNGKIYTQTGTDVEFEQYTIDYKFRVNTQSYTGSSVINYPALNTPITVYFAKNNPENHSLTQPNVWRLLFYFLLGAFLWILAALLLISGYYYFKKWQLLVNQIRKMKTY